MQTLSQCFSRTPRITPRRIKAAKPKTTRPTPQVAASIGFPRGPVRSVNILFKYMYRDASNYKQHGETIFTNDTFLALGEIEQQIRACLSEDKYFIARQVHLEERFFDALYDDDHPWHEFESIAATTLAPFDPAFDHQRDITEFIADLERVCRAGWNETDVRTKKRARRAMLPEIPDLVVLPFKATVLETGQPLTFEQALTMLHGGQAEHLRIERSYPGAPEAVGWAIFERTTRAYL